MKLACLCLLVTVSCLSLCLKAESHSALDSLTGTAQRLERLIDEKFVGPHGVLYSQLDENWRPFKSPLPVGEEVMIVPGATADEAGMRNYENSGMVQGEFLAAMCAKYRVTADPTALEKARRTYRGIRHVYEQSVALKGEGYYCKSWGGVAQPETSSDQYIYTLYGLDRYSSLASPAEQKEMVTGIWLRMGRAVGRNCRLARRRSIPSEESRRGTGRFSVFRAPCGLGDSVRRSGLRRWRSWPRICRRLRSGAVNMRPSDLRKSPTDISPGMRIHTGFCRRSSNGLRVFVRAMPLPDGSLPTGHCAGGQ